MSAGATNARNSTLALTLTLEISYPRHAGWILYKKERDVNALTLSALQSGEVQQRNLNAVTPYAVSSPRSSEVQHIHKGSYLLHSGSSAESFTMERPWSKLSDHDVMHIYGGPWTVGVETHTASSPLLQTARTPGARHVVRAEGVPPCYVRIEVVNPEGWDGPARVTSPYWVRHEGRVWLPSENILNTNGLAPVEPGKENFDAVATVVCSCPLPWALDWVALHEGSTCPISWPPLEVVQSVKTIPGLLVATGHSQSLTPHLEWRITCSAAELLLARSIPNWVKAVYRAFKGTLKYMLEGERVKLYTNSSNESGRKKVGSYHFKTVLFQVLTDFGPLNEENPAVLFNCLLSSLQSSLEKGVLSHYFIPGCNLLSTVTVDELAVTKRCIRELEASPCECILSSIPRINLNQSVCSPIEMVFGNMEAAVKSSLRDLQLGQRVEECMRVVERLDRKRREDWQKDRRLERLMMGIEVGEKHDERPSPVSLVKLIQTETNTTYTPDYVNDMNCNIM